MTLFYVAAVALGVLFVVCLVRDRRRFRNGVLLGLALVCLGIGLIGEAYRLGPSGFDIFQFVLFATPGLVVLVLAAFLIANGVTMLRREGRRLGNLLSLLVGLACLVVPALPVVAQYWENRPATVVAVVGLLLFTYVGFVFCCYLLYSTVYGRLGARPGADFVVVLGSRLIRGEVPPLLASRLDRGAEIWEAERRSGGDPVLITSGGKGPDESRPEADAMADHLVARGVPEESVLRENASTTTRENLLNSAALMSERHPGYRCVVVTNNFHAFRAALMTRQAGLDAQVLGSRTAAYYWPSATIREFVAILVEHRKLNLTVLVLLTALGVWIGLR